MTHPILLLQANFISALKADGPLTALLNGGPICDAPTRGQKPPFLVIRRHDVLSRDGDLAPVNDHRLLIHCWHISPSRKAVLAMTERVEAVALAGGLSGGGIVVTHAQHDRTDTTIDLKSGHAQAAIALRFLTEPTA